MFKRWIVEYDHKDGRKGTVEIETEVTKSPCFEYGNGKAGILRIQKYKESKLYDLRYCKEKDLHRAMVKDFFGDGLVKATEK